MFSSLNCIRMSEKLTFSDLLQFSSKLNKIISKSKDEERQLQITYREKMESLFLERDEALKGIPGFWAGILPSLNTPLSDFMNATFDAKLARAVSNFQIRTRSEGGKLIQEVTMSFKPNVMIESEFVCRELDSDGNTLSLKPIKWKKSVENLKNDSFFSFFEEEPKGGVNFISGVSKALDIVFQDPFVATIPES